jgi:hypothetical protein
MWKREGTQVSLDTARLAAQLDVSAPQAGIGNVVVRWNGNFIPLAPARILGVQLPQPISLESISDSWLRGDDVVVRYGQTTLRPFCPEIYWRFLSEFAQPTMGLELIISVQTSLWDALPRTSATSELQAEEMLWMANPSHAERPEPVPFRAGSEEIDVAGPIQTGCCLFRFGGLPFSYLEMIHPSDFSAAKLEWRDHRVRVQWDLFPESLEKGVIRRARLRGIWIPRHIDLEESVRQYCAFRESPLPLTT